MTSKKFTTSAGISQFNLGKTYLKGYEIKMREKYLNKAIECFEVAKEITYKNAIQE